MHRSRVSGEAFPTGECSIHQAFQKGVGSHSDGELFWRADGARFPAECWSYPVRQAGKIVGAVFTFLDISDCKRAEEERQKLVALVESSTDSIVIATPERQVLYLNQGGARMSGLTGARQATGRHRISPVSGLRSRNAFSSTSMTAPVRKLRSCVSI